MSSRIAEYAETVKARLKRTAETSGTQPGDPARVATAMVQVAESENPPRHLVLGAFGMEAVTKKLRGTLAEIEEWRETSLATDFPKL